VPANEVTKQKMSSGTVKVKIETFVERMFGENCLVVYTHQGGPCWVIDPGFPPQCEEVLDFIAKHKLTPAAVVLTHGHADHIAGVEHILIDHPDCPVWIGEGDDAMLTNAHANLSAPFGMHMVAPKPADAHLVPGSKLSLDGTTWQVLDTSGHSPGSRSFYCPEAKVVIVGDALFAGSIGRTDFPGADGETLLRNIRQSLFTLLDETVVYSGHGPTTTVGREKRTNPFLQGDE